MLRLRKLRTRAANRGRQSGLAMLALVTLLALVSSYFIASAITRTTGDVQIARDAKTRQTLNEAKAALIAYAALDSYSSGSSSFQPGALPCPDTNDDGNAEGSCTTAASRIGRFPWKTVGASDLRDGSGERLWYALSSNYRKLSGTTIVNPDTAGTLALSGSFTASNVPAIIFAPGAAFSTQTRDAAGLNNVSNYLEGWTAGGSEYSYYVATSKSRLTIGGNSTLVTPNQEDCSNTATEPYCMPFNDQLVTVSSDDIFKVVESTVPAMLQQLVTGGSLASGYFATYYSTWGRYPFPAQFTNPTSSNYRGTVGQTTGLLPVTTDSSFVTWRTSPTPTLTDTNISDGNISTQNCSATTSTVISCILTWTQQPTIQISVNLNGAGQAFVDAVSLSNLSLKYVIFGSNVGTIADFSVTHSLSPYQSGNSWGTVTLQFKLPTRNTLFGNVRLQISLPSFLAITTSGDANTGWMISNQWHRYLQYSVASGCLPNSSLANSCPVVPTVPCNVNTGCLTANGLPSGSFPNNNDKRVLLTFAGRALPADASAMPVFAAQTHHSSSLSDYYEGANSVADTTFTHQQGATRSFNDRVVVVAP